MNLCECGCGQTCKNRFVNGHSRRGKKNCNPKNLITLCINCNIKANYNREYWEEYYKNMMKRKNNL